MSNVRSCVWSIRRAASQIPQQTKRVIFPVMLTHRLRYTDRETLRCNREGSLCGLYIFIDDLLSCIILRCVESFRTVALYSELDRTLSEKTLIESICYHGRFPHTIIPRRKRLLIVLRSCSKISQTELNPGSVVGNRHRSLEGTCPELPSVYTNTTPAS